MDGQVALRVFFAVLLAFSLTNKARRPLRFVAGVREYGLARGRRVPAVALLIGVAEAALVVSLAVVPGRVPWLATAALLSVFTAAQAWSIGRGREHACHCFGDDERVGPVSLLRSLVLGLAALFVFAVGSPFLAITAVDPGIGTLAYVAAGLGAALLASDYSIRAFGRRPRRTAPDSVSLGAEPGRE